jgi:geranylgeranyl diphosphate synthase type I
MYEAHHAAEVLDRFRDLVDSQIERLLAGREDLLIYQVIRYHLGLDAEATAERAGKRMRAALCLLSCQACGGRVEAAAPAAAAVELLHSFTLLHDDIADQDDMRRGRPTVWREWGVGQAITAGDALFALANLSAGELDCSANMVAEVIRELNQATLTVCEGQQLDMSYEGRADIGVADYVSMIERKTAALMAAACAVGARLARARKSKREALRGFGRHLGVAFQITDDMLGIWGVAADLGKPVGSDVRRNKRSLPIIYLLEKAEPAEREALAVRLAAGIATEEEAAGLAARMEALGARSLCENTARKSLAAALAALEAVDLEAGARGDLEVLASYLIERQR